MKLDFSSLEKALTSLKKGFSRAEADHHDEELRDACIQRFEYTFELSWKMLKRQIELEVGSTPEVDTYSKRGLFRVAGERGLITNVESWFDYLEKRNLTTHTYDISNAKEVYSVIGNFIKDADALLKELISRRD